VHFFLGVRRGSPTGPTAMGRTQQSILSFFGKPRSASTTPSGVPARRGGGDGGSSSGGGSGGSAAGGWGGGPRPAAVAAARTPAAAAAAPTVDADDGMPDDALMLEVLEKVSRYVWLGAAVAWMHLWASVAVGAWVGSPSVLDVHALCGLTAARRLRELTPAPNVRSPHCCV